MNKPIRTFLVILSVSKESQIFKYLDPSSLSAQEDKYIFILKSS